MSANLAALLSLGGAIFAFLGSLGLLRLPTFYERVHPPAMGTTLGTALVLAGSIVHFTALEARPVVHEIVLGVLITATMPVNSMLLVRAARRRDARAAQP